MRHAFPRPTWPLAVLAMAALAAPVSAQTAGATQAPGTIRRLSVDEAVALALEQNLGIQIDRLNPQIQELSIAQARTFSVPTLTSGLTNSSQNSPSTSALAGGREKITDSKFSSQFGLAQVLPTGADYSISWNSFRSTSTNLYNSYQPLINSGLAMSFTQPLLRNYKIDTNRQVLETSRKDREAADVQLQSTIAVTRRDVKNAYWDLTYQIENLKAQQQSLDLAKRLLADNEKRVQIGTMAPIDIVEAQSEVARNEEVVIVAEAGIKQAEDRLRALIFDPAMPDFWSVVLEPTESLPFAPQSIDTNAAIQRAISNRTDVQLAKNNLAKTDINIRYFHNQALPDVSAQAAYQSNAAGGSLLSPLVSFPSGGGNRTVVSRTGFGSVLGDVLSGTYPTWTFGLTVSYPIGSSASEANLARARLQRSQAEAQLRNLELDIATQVRDAARQVQTNQKRVDSARAARELAERRLEAEEKKFAAGIQISFFVFQAQRDLSQARTNEIRALSDFNKSLVSFDAVQETVLR